MIVVVRIDNAKAISRAVSGFEHGRQRREQGYPRIVPAGIGRRAQLAPDFPGVFHKRRFLRIVEDGVAFGDDSIGIGRSRKPGAPIAAFQVQPVENRLQRLSPVDFLQRQDSGPDGFDPIGYRMQLGQGSGRQPLVELHRVSVAQFLNVPCGQPQDSGALRLRNAPWLRRFASYAQSGEIRKPIAGIQRREINRGFAVDRIACAQQGLDQRFAVVRVRQQNIRGLQIQAIPREVS
ncbi:MAG: hypothetical protein BWZ10_01518 [candidate division BRC1 bacterium ADurb.BinA364]|nr:MAG: hypothetical protein BWZ10_01518 [candidate division BRC1 bacterium ADurb.BinA364]